MSSYPLKGRVIGFIILVILSIISGVVITSSLDRYASSGELMTLCCLVFAGLFAAYVSLALAEASIRKGVDYKIPGILSLVVAFGLLGGSLVVYSGYQPSLERLDELTAKKSSKYRIEQVTTYLLHADALEKGLTTDKRTYYSYANAMLSIAEAQKWDPKWIEKIDPKIGEHVNAIARRKIKTCAQDRAYCSDNETLAIALPFIAADDEMAKNYKKHVANEWKTCSEDACREKLLGLLERALGKAESRAFAKARYKELYERLETVGVTKSESLDERMAALKAADMEYALREARYNKIPEALAMRAAYEVHRAALVDTRPALGQSKKHFRLLASDLVKGRREYTIDKSLTYLLDDKSGVKVITREHEGKITGAMLTFDYSRKSDVPAVTETEQWIERLTGTAVNHDWSTAKTEELVINQTPVDVKLDDKARPARVIIGDYPTVERAESIVWLATGGKQAEEADKLIRVSLAAAGVSAGRADYDRYYAERRKKVEDDVATRGYYSRTHMTSLVVIPIPTTRGRTNYKTGGGYRPSSSYSNRSGSYSSSSSSSRSSYSSGSYGSGK